MSQYLPVANGMKSFWLTAESDFSSHRSTEELPKEIDTIIIGSGYSGATTAYYLSQGDLKNASNILMLEARNICSGATARNGGHLKPELYYDYNSLKNIYGEKGVAEIMNFEYAHLEAVKELVEKEDIDCDFVLSRACDVHLHSKSVDKAISNYYSMTKNPYLKYKRDVQIKFGDQARIISKVEDSPVCVTYSAGQLWPYKLIIHLLKHCVKKGMNLQSNTPVTKVEKLNDGRYLVKTPRGDIITNKLILATNAYTASVEPKFEDKIVPIKGICSHIVSSDPTKHTPHLTNTYGIRFGEANTDYLINRPDGSVVVGGAKKHIFPYKDVFYKNVDDSTLIKGSKEYFDNYMQKRFYTWKNFDSKPDYVWSGILGYSDDSLPYVGELPGDKNKFIIAGFHGHGMPRVLLCAKALANFIKGDKGPMAIPQSFKITPERMTGTKNEILKSLTIPLDAKL